MSEASDNVPAEFHRLEESRQRKRNWQRWGPYLSERQWGTVREDYSANGEPWTYFPHDHARSRAYRWGEDGLLGITDRECRLCFAVALWNGRDPILKERLFGLTPGEANHGEDVKECYFYLDATPTHSYLKALYKYPQREYPYQHLVDENRRRNAFDEEYELLDTGVFEGNRYFDVLAEYAKAGPDDILIRLSVTNRGGEGAELDLLANLWFRNTWTPASPYEDWGRPVISQSAPAELLAEHSSLGNFRLLAGAGPDGRAPQWLFTDNQTNHQRVFGTPNGEPFVKDAFHEYIVHGRKDAVRSDGRGTKAAGRYHLRIEPGQTVELRLRLVVAVEESGDRHRIGEQHADSEPVPISLGPAFQTVFDQRIAEAGEFYDQVIPCCLPPAVREPARQAYAGLLWTEQFYCYVVKDWLAGDPGMPPPPPGRKYGRNHQWRHLFNRNILSMPDKWEFPWYAAWDSAFQMLPMAGVDPEFAKDQLVLLLREWFMHPSGQLPAYEFAFSDVNPPVHAWACWRVYKIAGKRQGGRDRLFLERTFQKLLLNFTWWVNRKDVEGRHVFSGGFLGMDNIGPFDRSEAAAGGSALEQADGTAWMAFYCLTMLEMALELAKEDPAYEDTASKFFTHFTAISDAMNSLGGRGLWDEQDGFYYDMICSQGRYQPLRVRSIVGLIPLLAVAVLDDKELERHEGFRQRMKWFLQYRKDLAGQVSFMDCGGGCGLRLLAMPSRGRLERVLGRMLDENEFLSPYGIRSLSRAYQADPHVFEVSGQKYCIGYEPGESLTNLFGGNSNWRGPVWLPINYLLIEALERYHRFYGDSLQVECPTGSGRRMNLKQVSEEIRRRVCRIFLPDEQGRRPWWGQAERFRDDPAWNNLTLFHEYYHGDSGKGLGASHQTGWTALIVRLLEDMVANGG